MAALVRMTRTRGHYRDSVRAYQVEIDGQRVGSVRPGETKDFPVEAGEHGVRLTVDWCRSPLRVVRLGDGQWTQFVCSPNGWFFEIWKIITNIDDYIRLEQMPAPPTGC